MAEKRRLKLKLLEWEDLERCKYPTYFTAMFNYYATGEGHTLGVCMGLAYSYQELRARILADFGDWFGGGAEVALGLVLFPDVKHLIPGRVVKLIRTIQASGSRQPYMRLPRNSTPTTHSFLFVRLRKRRGPEQS